MSMVCWLDGRLVPPADATVSVLSNAVFRGTTVFDVMSVMGTRSGPAVLGLGQHLRRQALVGAILAGDHPLANRWLTLVS
jgi:branched-subunit amino acid aminotransferase/4-amino-4-deoxychorismate lyase